MESIKICRFKTVGDGKACVKTLLVAFLLVAMSSIPRTAQDVVKTLACGVGVEKSVTFLCKRTKQIFGGGTYLDFCNMAV